MPHPTSNLGSRVLALIVALTATHGQLVPAAQQQSPPVFRGGVDLVTVDVTVVDKNGRPVKGLTADDFTVRLEGQVRPVRALDFLEFSSDGRSTPPPSSRQTTNRTAASAVGRGRVFLFVFDDLSYPAGTGKLQVAAAERMLSKFENEDLIGLATTSGLGPALNPTRDRPVLLTALRDKRLIGRYNDGNPLFYIAINEAIQIERGMPADTLRDVVDRECPRLHLDPDVCAPMIESHSRSLVQQSVHRVALQLSAYKHVIDALRLAPAPRIVIAFSRGLAFGAEHHGQSQLDPISRAAAEAGVQFYALSDVPDEIDLSTGGRADEAAPAHESLMNRPQTAKREEGRFLNSGIQTLASAAGGEAFIVSGTADRFIQRIATETSGFYRLGVETPILPDVRRFATAKVAVRQPGLTVHVRPQAILASAPPEAANVDERLRAELAQGSTSFGVPIALATVQRRDPASNELQLAVNVQLPESVPGPVVAMFGLVDTMGKVLQAGRKDVASTSGGAYQLAFPIPAPPGDFRLRFAVADAQGNIGSVEQPVKVQLLHIGGFSASDLLATWAGADRQSRFLALETLPDGATTLNASLELYADDPANAPDVIVRMALLPAGSQTPIVEREIVPRMSGETSIASTELPVAKLNAGSYLIRATVVERGIAVGTVSMSVRKTGAATDVSPAPAATSLNGFRHWLDLAQEHTPGQLDEAVREVRSYSINRLTALRADLEALTALLRNPYDSRAVREYSEGDQQALQAMAFAEVGARTYNRLLRSIAILHTDAAVLPGAVPYVADPWATTPVDVMVSEDGRPVQRLRMLPHFPIARAALGSITPGVAETSWVRTWYRATTAYLFSTSQLVALPDHLADRRKALPDDAGMTFAEGCLFEAYSADAIQSAAQAERARGGKTNVPGLRDALVRARQLFEQVSPDDPDSAEARVRLARTKLRLGDARGAAADMDAWLAGGGQDRELRYYAFLVLGAARWTLGEARPAIVAYEKALELYPTAQSAAVALLLVKPGGDIEPGSPVLTALQSREDRVDPWSNYRFGLGRNVEALLKRIWDK